jgi:hypothetical protein
VGSGRSFGISAAQSRVMRFAAETTRLSPISMLESCVSRWLMQICGGVFRRL